MMLGIAMWLNWGPTGPDQLEEDAMSPHTTEEFDEGYSMAFREIERHVRQSLLEGRRHVFEAEIKVAEQHG